jgi:hypothetical protein
MTTGAHRPSIERYPPIVPALADYFARMAAPFAAPRSWEAVGRILTRGPLGGMGATPATISLGGRAMLTRPLA